MKPQIARVPPAPVLLSFAHGAAYLNQAYTSFVRTVRDYRLDVVRLGRRNYVKKADLDQLVVRQTEAAWHPAPSLKQIDAQRERRQRERADRERVA